ncbi:MAG: S1/P1 nuclease [Planctomycetota bacterium]
MRTSLAWKIVPLVLLVVPAPCLGWGQDGHRIVAVIATDYLTPPAQATVNQLLGGPSLADVANWADEIKSDRTYRWASPLHYANVAPEADGFDLARDCPPDGCVVSAIIKYAEVLRSKDAGAIEKTEALKFLVHFVGDVHQPLHVSRAKDKGGNDIKVDFFYDRTNLHRVWDSELIRRTKKPWSPYAAELRQAITPELLAEWRGVTDPGEWATESYRLALSHAYAVPQDGQLGQEYFERCIPVVDQRLTMAGVRLATLLNRIFAEDGGPIQGTETQPASQPASAPAFEGGRNSDGDHTPTTRTSDRSSARTS